MVYLSLTAVAAGAGELSPAAASAPVELDLPDLEGRERSLGEFRGKVVLVNFWAGWCTPCIEEMPSIQRLADTMRGKPFAVVGVNAAEGRLRVKAMVQRLGIAFPVLLDQDSIVFNRWDATMLPTTYVLDDGVYLRNASLALLRERRACEVAVFQL
jgi:thiol-disulfide isomerase/thioredoxin